MCLILLGRGGGVGGGGVGGAEEGVCMRLSVCGLVYACVCMCVCLCI